MSIEFRKVTWYSIIFSVIVFVGTIPLSFYVYGQFKAVVLLQQSATSLDKIVPLGGDVALRVGESATYDDFRITFKSMIQDNRCPGDVLCIEAGAVTADVTMNIYGQDTQRNFPSDEVPYQIGNYIVSIVRATPPARSTVQIDPKNYIVIFHIAKAVK